MAVWTILNEIWKSKMEIRADAFVRKFSANGNEFWRGQFGDPSVHDGASAVAVDAYGMIYLAGTTWAR